jgi:hypothetical protein
MKRLLLPITVAMLAGALLAPALASADVCNPKDAQCLQRQRLQDQKDGVTQPCRTAFDKYEAARDATERALKTSKLYTRKQKRAKSKKAKRKYLKKSIKADKVLIKAKDTEFKLRDALTDGCEGSTRPEGKRRKQTFDD